jgi:thiol-disulfide isomerase/thioredoxin
MKFDYYCVALAVLVLFFMYLDNSVNIEGLSSVGDHAHSKQLVASAQAPQAQAPQAQAPQAQAPQAQAPQAQAPQAQQDLTRIGQKPTQLKPLNFPPSLKSDLQAVSSSSDNLASLDGSFGLLVDPQLIQKQVPSDLHNLGSRVGGVGNIGDASIGLIGGPVKPVGSMQDVMGLPVLENPSIGAPVGYGVPVISGVKKPENVPLGKPAMPGMASGGVVPGMASGGKVASNMVPQQPSSGGPKKKIEVHMVYTNWCGHSKRAEPHLDKLKQDVHKKQMGDHVIEVHKHDADTPEGKKIAVEHNVRGFPTHFMVVEGKKIEGGVGRTYDELMGKIKELTNTA